MRFNLPGSAPNLSRALSDWIGQQLSRPLWLWGAATTALPTTTDSGANEGALAYDETVDAPVFRDATAWIRLADYYNDGTAIAVGTGDASATPGSGRIRAPNSTGTNVVGGQLFLDAGLGTGNVTPSNTIDDTGDVAIRTPTPGASGSTQQVLAARVNISQAGIAVLGFASGTVYGFIHASSALVSTGSAYKASGGWAPLRQTGSTQTFRTSTGGFATVDTLVLTNTGAVVTGALAATGAVSGSNLSGTNTGDQTSIVGITGTKAQFDTAVTDGNILYVGDVSATAAGTYTPTLTNVANLAASTAYSCQYSQVGSVVTVSGQFDVDPTLAATSTQLGISLPVASNLANANECAGTAFASGVAGMGAAILGDAVNNRAQMQWVSSDITNQPLYFQFSYRVLV